MLGINYDLKHSINSNNTVSNHKNTVFDLIVGFYDDKQTFKLLHQSKYITFGALDDLLTSLIISLMVSAGLSAHGAPHFSVSVRMSCRSFVFSFLRNAIHFVDPFSFLQEFSFQKK